MLTRRGFFAGLFLRGPKIDARARTRYQEDPWDERIVRYLRRRSDTDIPRIWQDCLGLAARRRTQADANRIAAILQRAGWRKQRRYVDGRRVRISVYVPAPPVGVSA